jgi:hypothetical protein
MRLWQPKHCLGEKSDTKIMKRLLAYLHLPPIAEELRGGCRIVPYICVGLP